MLYTFIERIVLPALVAIFIAGGLASFALGCALVFRQAAALRFMTRMNRWVSTRETFAPLDARIDIEPPARPDGRRPLLGTIFLVAGLGGIALVLWRVHLPPAAKSPAWLLTGIALEAAKWILVVGFAFAAFVGALMLAAPRRLAALEQRLNRWHSTETLAAAAEKVHTPLDPLVAAYPRASGSIIAIVSLLMVLAMVGLAVKLH